jgi:hypothetical protein
MMKIYTVSKLLRNIRLVEFTCWDVDENIVSASGILSGQKIGCGASPAKPD